MFFSGAFFWVTSTTLIKLSLLHFYRAVFLNRAISSARSTILQYVAFGLYILIVSFWTGRVLLSLLMCRPIQKQWDFSLPGHCGNFTAQEISISTINMVLDFSIVLLPMPFLWNLQLPRKKKLAVNVTFSLGIWLVPPICPQYLTGSLFSANQIILQHMHHQYRSSHNCPYPWSKRFHLHPCRPLSSLRSRNLRRFHLRERSDISFYTSPTCCSPNGT